MSAVTTAKESLSMVFSPTAATRSRESLHLESQVERLKRGDQDAWTALFEAEYDRIFRLLVSLVADADAAEDLASQVFFEAVAGIGRYRDRGRPIAAWLFAIARHRAVDWQRRQRRRRLAHAALVTEPAPAGGPDTIADFVAALKPDQAQVVHLRFVEGYDVDEVAHLLGRSTAAVRQLQHRAIAALRARFARSNPGVQS